MSAKSTAEKLRIRPDTTLWTSHPDRVELLGPLPPGVRVVDCPSGAGTALVFGDDRASVTRLVAEQAERLAGADTLWVAYPKGNRTDVNRDSLVPILAEHGLRPVAQISLDDVWSAMRFRPLRPGEEPFAGGSR